VDMMQKDLSLALAQGRLLGALGRMAGVEA
jgi:hypothetical protein